MKFSLRSKFFAWLLLMSVPTWAADPLPFQVTTAQEVEVASSPVVAPATTPTIADVEAQYVKLHHLAEGVHEALERDNPDLKGVQGAVEQLWYNWNYFRTIVNQVRLAHSLDGDDPDADRHIKNASALALFTHLTEHVIGHGMHYLSTYSDSAWVRWGGAVVGEAIASPFVEVVCIAGVVIYARSSGFQNAVTFVRVAAYSSLLKWWAEPIARTLGLGYLRDAFFESRSGFEQLALALASSRAAKYVVHVPGSEMPFLVKSSAGKILARMELDLRSNDDIVLRRVEFHPESWNAEEERDLAKGLWVFGWNIRDAVLGSAQHIKKKHFQMLAKEVFLEKLETVAESGGYSLYFKNDSIRRFRRRFFKNPCIHFLSGH
jgi:hypothetical protein